LRLSDGTLCISDFEEKNAFFFSTLGSGQLDIIYFR
ncbi:hypothetical protein X975_04910, partial [Stegodyphus mimosarum]